MSENVMLLTENVGQVELDTSESSRPGCLGRLKGIIADFKNPTRNNRTYGLDLWKRVFNTEWVKEALDTLTLYGEADHPLDRLETKMSEAAVVLVDYDIDESKGIVTGIFDILDTPNGRIIRALSEYGSKLGVSSRGQGSVVETASGQQVDPKSYIFAGFDVVILPAVKTARQEYTNESLKVDSFLEPKRIILEEIESSTNVNDLMKIQSLLESSNLSVKDDLESNINSKLLELSSDPNTIGSQVYQDLDEALQTIEKLSAQVSLLEANTISFDDHRRLSDELRRTKRQLVESKDNSSRLSEQLESVIGKTAELLESRSHAAEVTPVDYDTLDAYKSEIDRLNESVHHLSNELKIANDLRESVVNRRNRKISTLSSELEHSNKLVESLSSTISELESRPDKVRTEVIRESVEPEVVEVPIEVPVEVIKEVRNTSDIKLIENLTSKNSRLAHSNSNLSTKYSNIKSEYNSVLTEYAKLLCRSEGVAYNPSLFESLDSMDKVKESVSDLLESKSVINSLPVTFNDSTALLTESVTPTVDNADKSTKEDNRLTALFSAFKTT